MLTLYYATALRRYAFRFRRDIAFADAAALFSLLPDHPPFHRHHRRLFTITASPPSSARHAFHDAIELPPLRHYHAPLR